MTIDVKLAIALHRTQHTGFEGIDDPIHERLLWPYYSKPDLQKVTWGAALEPEACSVASAVQLALFS